MKKLVYPAQVSELLPHVFSKSGVKNTLKGIGDMQVGNINEQSGLGGHCDEIETSSFKVHVPVASLCLMGIEK